MLAAERFAARFAKRFVAPWLEWLSILVVMTFGTARLEAFGFALLVTLAAFGVTNVGVL
jgi:hypothetical protein